MANYSKLILIGHVVRDPEQRALQSGETVAEFTVPYTERRRGQDGEWVDGPTAWYRVSAFGALAERAVVHLHKGTYVYVEGVLLPREYTDQQGQRRISLDVRARESACSTSARSTASEPLPCRLRTTTSRSDHTTLPAEERVVALLRQRPVRHSATSMGLTSLTENV